MFDWSGRRLRETEVMALVVGLDFAFSFPRWRCEEEGWSEAAEVWASRAASREKLLAECPAPFRGRPARRAPTLSSGGCAGPSVRKGRWAERHRLLFEHFPDQRRELLERAAGSEERLRRRVLRSEKWPPGRMDCASRDLSTRSTA